MRCKKTCGEGSPPRMRGRAPAPAPTWQSPRITPAYAGKRKRAGTAAAMGGDHPRVCGEERPTSWPSTRPRGSPPRMRGRAIEYATDSAAYRITPAYAGKRQAGAIFGVSVRDHPRVCGEEHWTAFWDGVGEGSPPRMRGRAAGSSLTRPVCGITPAYAGKRLKKFHSIGHFSCILCLFHSVLHRASASGGSRAGPCAPPCLPAQNAIPV